MFMMFGVACLPQHGLAQQSLSPDAVETIKAKLTPYSVKVIQRETKSSLRALMMHAYKCSADGIVTKDNHAATGLIEAAIMRSRLVQPFLQMDLNADGDVTRAEFEQFVRTQEPDVRVRSEMSWGGGDANGDGVMTITEMLAVTQKQFEMSNERKNGLQGLSDEILMMDVDGDGQVTINELRVVVEAISNTPIQ